jgi:hypothetical protein
MFQKEITVTAKEDIEVTSPVIVFDTNEAIRNAVALSNIEEGDVIYVKDERIRPEPTMLIVRPEHEVVARKIIEATKRD